MPHLGNLIGSALSADVIARFLRLQGHSVVFVSGSDEHGSPIEVEAMKNQMNVREFVDRNHNRISELFKKWQISYDNYTRTESPVHTQFVQEHYRLLEKNGYVFQQDELVHYCPKDKRFLPDRFIEGICPHCSEKGARGDQCDRCGRPLDAVKLVDAHCIICDGNTEIKRTTHWFFDLPKLQEEIKNFIVSNKDLSENAVKFSIGWLNEGLKPRSITRDTSWGIPAPFEGADGKTIYVWMEAVLGYVSAVIEYFKRTSMQDRWRDFWLDKNTKSCYFIGKDNIPFHAIVLTGLLMAAKKGYTLPSAISSTEFLNFEGQKFSKRNKVGIWIDEALELLPPDYWRYTLLSTRPETGDVNFTYVLLEEKVNGDLNDAIGNFVNRTLALIKRFLNGAISEKPRLDQDKEESLTKLSVNHNEITRAYEEFRLQKAVRLTLEQAQLGNIFLNSTEPWRIFKENHEEGAASLYVAARFVKALAIELSPITPEAASKIWSYLGMRDPLGLGVWSLATTDFKLPMKLSEFVPLFSKMNKKEISSKLNELRAKKTGEN